MRDQIPPPLAYLADAVKSRRRVLGLTRDGLHRAGGPSDSTMARIENPNSSTAFPRPSTLERLDLALRWQQGSAAKCLDLREPLPSDGEHEVRGESNVSADTPTALLTDPLDFEYVAVSAEVIREGLALIQSLTSASASMPDESRGLVRFAHQLAAAHATEVLERFGGAGRVVPGFLQTAFGPFLVEDVPAEFATPQQQDEQVYRRWLAGLQDDGDGRFADRLARKLRAIG